MVMSSIFGICSRDGRPIAPERVELMRRACFYPNTRSIHAVEGPAAFGSVLAGDTLLPEEAPAPSESVRPGALLAFSGRLDNHQELREALGASHLAPASDVALVRKGYEAWGLEVANKLIGDFVLAVWDPERHRLYCARDAMGVRQLFYCLTDREIAFASHLRQLTALSQIQPDFDDEYFGDLLIEGQTPLGTTPYKGMARLPAGHYLLLEDDRIRLERYWRPEEQRKILCRDPREYAEHLRRLITRAVAAQLGGPGPIWCEVSGGLDSSTVACVSHQLLLSGEASCRGLSAITVVFDREGPGEERRYWQSVLDQCGFPSHQLAADQDDVFSEMDAGAEHWDEPNQQLRFFSHYRRYAELLRQHGVKVLLRGGGAEVAVMSEATGPFHLLDLLRQRRMGDFRNEIKAWQAMLQIPLMNLLWTYLGSPVVRGPRSRYFKSGERVPTWLAPKFVKALGLKDRVNRGWMPNVFRSPGDQWQFEKIGRVPLYRGNLERAAEIRYPFLYRPLIDFSLAIPFEHKVSSKIFKPLLREAMVGVLPQVVRQRKNKGDISRWVVCSLARQWPRIEPQLRTSVLGDLGFVDPVEFLRAVKLFAYGRTDRTVLISTAIALEFWVRHVLNRPAAQLRTSGPSAVG